MDEWYHGTITSSRVERRRGTTGSRSGQHASCTTRPGLGSANWPTGTASTTRHGTKSTHRASRRSAV
eukprot:4358013-Prymnesium_polylepis.1